MRNAIIAAVVLAACAPTAPVSNPDGGGSTGPALSGAATYGCDNGQTIQATRGPRAVRLLLQDGRQLDLPRVEIPGRNVTYAADGWVWVVDGDRAVLTEQGGQANCTIGADATGGFAPLENPVEDA